MFPKSSTLSEASEPPVRRPAPEKVRNGRVRSLENQTFGRSRVCSTKEEKPRRFESCLSGSYN